MTSAAEPPGADARRIGATRVLPTGREAPVPDLVELDAAGLPTGRFVAVPPGTRLAAFYTYWLSCAHGSVLPDMSAIDPLRMPPEILAFMVMYEIDPPTAAAHAPEPFRIRTRLVGTAVVERSGVDLTGSIVEPTGLTATQHARLSWALANRRPFIAHGQVPAVERDYIQFTVLVLPFADGGGEIRRLVSVLQFRPPS